MVWIKKSRKSLFRDFLVFAAEFGVGGMGNNAFVPSVVGLIFAVEVIKRPDKIIIILFYFFPVTFLSPVAC